MVSSNDPLVQVLMGDREREMRRAAEVAALLRQARRLGARGHSLRAWLGFSLIQVGRALLRRGPASLAARRRLA